MGSAERIHTHTYENGLVLLAEEMDWLESAAFSLLLPCGCRRDPAEKIGVANFLCEMIQRGCGDRSSRQFVEDLDNLGVSRSASVSNAHLSFGGAMPADKIDDALAIYADLLLRPHLPEDQIEDARLVCLQEIHGLQDDLAQQTLLELRRRRYADPLGRSALGTETSIGMIDAADVRSHYETHCRPNESILAVAGNIDWPRLRDHVGSLLGSWSPREAPQLTESPAEGGYVHLQHESHQTHIGVAFDAVPYGHPEYYSARGAVGVLSDGMSSRLFTEIRENRGLCYTVYSICHSLRDQGSVFSYAGTTTERAQETLDVLLQELVRLRDGVGEDELDRLKSKIKAALIMQQESSSSRSGSMAGDWYFLQRVQTLEEIGRIIDDLTCERINDYLTQHPPRDFVVVTLGNQKLELPVGIS